MYNWKKIFTVANGNATECVRIIKMLTYNEIPKNKYDPIYWYRSIDFSGQSFILHPDVLIYNSYKYSNRDVGIYLSYASIRPYAEYIASGTITLHLNKVPMHPHEYLNNHRLLPIENNIIHFPYEEVPSKKEQH